MGADGHIVIYDLDKAIELGIIKDPEISENNDSSDSSDSSEENSESEQEKPASFYDLGRILRTDHIYIQTIFGHRVITSYWDTERFCRNFDVELTEREEEIATIMSDECYIDTWEVWT